MSLQSKQILSEKQLSILNSEMEKYKKSVGLAYILYIFFGSIGLHKFYMGETKQGATYLLLGIIGWITFISGFTPSGGMYSLWLLGLLCLVTIVILLIIDLFTIPKQINEKNEKIENKFIRSLTSNNN